MADIEVTTSGAEVTATPSDRIVLRLPENGGTGYQWSVDDVTDPLAVESNDFVRPATLVPGAVGERVVTLRPSGTGRARVSLQLKRDWEPEPIDRFCVDVTVAKG